MTVSRSLKQFFVRGNFLESFQLCTVNDDCVLLVGTGNVLFDAVAFETRTGDISLVAMNLKEAILEFDIHDVAAPGEYCPLELPLHSITTCM